MKKTKKFWLLLSALIIVLAVAAYFWSRETNSKVTYRTEKIDRGEIVISISATGTLNALTTVLVGSEVSGTIAKLYADFNSVVKEGDLLAQLDPTFLQASVDEQEANMERAQAQVNESERNYNRTKQLFEKKMVSQADMDAAMTNLETARASLKQAAATLQRAKVNRKYATIRAPISGVVISRDVDIGQTVAASLSAPTIFTIANDLSKMQLEASIDEADIGSVKDGQNVSFRVDAYPENEFAGQVSQVRLAPIISQNVVTYNVIIDVANPELKLMPGMTANLTIEVARRDNALRAPVTATRFTPAASEISKNIERKPDSGKGGNPNPTQGAAASSTPRMKSGGVPDPNQVTLWVLQNGQPRPMKAIKGLQATRYVELLDTELKEGDEVIVGTNGEQATASKTQTQMPFGGQMMGGGRH
jgi:HlyD family secretion protein